MVKISKKRIIGASFFGFILGTYITKALEFTIPNILVIINKIDIAEAQRIYEGSIILELAVLAVVSFFIGVLAAFIARKNGVLVGVLANSFTIFLLLGLLIFAILFGRGALIGNIPIQLYALISLVVTIIASVLGGYSGQKYYSPDIDLDLGQDKLTIFGIRWFHYFWILPFIFYPFLTSLLLIIYAAVLMFLSHFYFMIHPSLWFNFGWWAYFLGLPMLVMFAGFIFYSALLRFWEVIRYKQTKSKGIKRFGKILLYGIGAPILVSFVAWFASTIIHNMPKPSAGDWKIGIGLMLIIPTIALIVGIFSWVKDRFSN